MFVSVILDSEYMGMGERIKWFMKNLSHALENDCLIITHEYLKIHYDELTRKCSERFYYEFEMRHLNKKELEKIDIVYIPDSFFDDLYNKCRTRTRMILELSNNRFLDLEKYIMDAIDENLKRRQERKVDAIFNCLHCFASISRIGEIYGCPIIPYTFSAVRKVHGYQQTLYMANMSADLMNNDEIKRMYDEFDPNQLEFPLFSNEEILALIGKKRNLPLLPLVQKEGIFEMGIAREGFQILPQSYCYNKVTDDDLYYECKKYYESNQIISRLHPIQLDQSGIGRHHMKNDPIAFILSCKRVATVQSQMIMKAALWNRIPCVLGEALPYSFLFSSNMNGNKKINKKELNFIIWGYFIPDSCMFSASYWKWRMTRPSIHQIIEKHVQEIIRNLGYQANKIKEKENRLINILEQRRCDKYLIQEITQGNIAKNISYQCLSSKIRIFFIDDEFEDIFCLNLYMDGSIKSHFRFQTNKKIDYLIFYPMDDADGEIMICSISSSNNIKYRINHEYKYYSKSESDIKILVQDREIKDLDIEIEFKLK